MNDTVGAHAENVLKKTLRTAGLKVTPLRIEVLGRLTDAARPLSHSEIQTMMPDIDRVTLYRTLSSFVDADIAHQVQGLDGMWRFCAHARDESRCPGNHPHFLCLSCGTMVCLTDQVMPRINVPEGCIVSGKQLVVYGKCQNCADEEHE
ncbi:MAG: transcriptional repressor [Synergistaceae bacterium]|nr:transcriptional repressor [Synergistaceae bacterium]